MELLTRKEIPSVFGKHCMHTLPRMWALPRRRVGDATVVAADLCFLSPIAIAVGTYLVLMSVPAVQLVCLLTQPVTACMVKVCSVPTNTFGVIQRMDMT